MRYANLFVAGTFDGLHAGHRFLLTRAFAMGEKVTIGLTSDAFVRQRKAKGERRKAKTYEERNAQLRGLLTAQKKRATIIPIDDPHEPAASMKDLDALIVTKENRKTGEHINVLRQSSALPSLTLIEVPMVSAVDGKPISSTRVRNGEIDHNGKLIMPESMREELGKPLGKVLTAMDVKRLLRSETFRVTVGDIATKTFLDAGTRPFLAIIDGKVGRKPFREVVDRLQSEKASPFKARAVKSGPGYISKEAVKAIRGGKGGGTHPRVLLIDGEEDLLVLPAVIHAPIGAVVYYGQPGEGLVEVVVTPAKKKEARALIAQFLS